MDNEQFLKNLLNVQNQHVVTLTELMERSERRIDQTNDMVHTLAAAMQSNHSVLTKITDEYSKHLDSLSECRNALIEQNKSLLKIHENDAHDKRELRKELSALHDKVFDILCRLSGAHGVKVENNLGRD